ncbi:MAG: hypothetical protein V1847_04020 [Candidatus Diapherotrites archaeon]
MTAESILPFDIDEVVKYGKKSAQERAVHVRTIVWLLSEEGTFSERFEYLKKIALQEAKGALKHELERVL